MTPRASKILSQKPNHVIARIILLLAISLSEFTNLESIIKVNHFSDMKLKLEGFLEELILAAKYKI